MTYLRDNTRRKFQLSRSNPFRVFPPSSSDSRVGGSNHWRIRRRRGNPPPLSWSAPAIVGGTGVAPNVSDGLSPHAVWCRNTSLRRSSLGNGEARSCLVAQCVWSDNEKVGDINEIIVDQNEKWTLL